jgi:hypothetical protein
MPSITDMTRLSYKRHVVVTGKVTGDGKRLTFLNIPIEMKLYRGGENLER